MPGQLEEVDCREADCREVGWEADCWAVVVAGAAGAEAGAGLAFKKT